VNGALVRSAFSALASTLASGFRAFIEKNKEISRSVESRLPHARLRIHDEYEQTVARFMNSFSTAAVLVDVGGGKRCHFAKYRRDSSPIKLIAVDASQEALAQNDDVDDRFATDVMDGLPFQDQSIDMIVSRSVLEHLRDVEFLIADSARVLKREGLFIHVFPSKFAPFSVANQLLPRRFSRRLLFTLIPGSEGEQGFPAYYDRTYPSAIRRLLGRHGFEVVDMRLSYYQAEYFDFFVPLYLVNALYELVAQTLALENLAAAVLVVARKR
jgi:ubiquinone/menaquinone biosynthesis C-methylase UbiE